MFLNGILHMHACKNAANDLWKLSKISQFLSSRFKLWNNLNFYWEFDPGSGWTLAACLRHASRTRRPTDSDWDPACLHKGRISDDVDSPPSGKRVSNTWVTCLIDRDTVWKRTLIPDVVYGLKGALKAPLWDGPAVH